MRQNLLIIGAGIYGLVAKEIAESMGCFEKIDFIDDRAKETPNGILVIGTSQDLTVLSPIYTKAVVAIGNPRVRLSLLQKIEAATPIQIVSLVSPRAYVSPTAQIGKGCVIEPMAVIHTNCVLEAGCLISAGAVVNHAAHCGVCVHVDCNAVVAGNVYVPADHKVCSGTVFSGK